MDRKTRFSYSSSLKLGPAIGDWTVLQYRDPALDDIQVSQIQNVSFDSLTKDALKTLHFIHYRLAETMAQKLSKNTDLKVELHTVVASQMTYEDFLLSQHDKVVQADYIVENFGRVNVVFGWSLADMIVNRLTGGTGEDSESEAFSTAEVVVLRAQMDELVEPFVDAWGGAFSPSNVRSLFNVGQFIFDQKISLREAYVAFTVYLYFGKGDLRHVTWAYPSSVIRCLLREKTRLHKGLKPSVYLSASTLKSSTVDVVATLGKATLTMKELKTLQPGDVIPLDSAFNQFIEVKLGLDIIMKGQPCQRKDKVCLQVFFDQDESLLSPVVVSPIEEMANSSSLRSSELSSAKSQLSSKALEDSLVFENELGESAHDELGAALYAVDQDMDIVRNDPVSEIEDSDFKNNFSEEPKAAQSVSSEGSSDELDDDDFDWDDFDEDEDL